MLESQPCSRGTCDALLLRRGREPGQVSCEETRTFPVSSRKIGSLYYTLVVHWLSTHCPTGSERDEKINANFQRKTARSMRCHAADPADTRHRVPRPPHHA